MYYDINYRLKTTSTFTVEATSKHEAKELALNQLFNMSKNELIERFLAALDFDPTFTITSCEIADWNN